MAQGNQAGRINFLIDAEADVNAKTVTGLTPLLDRGFFCLPLGSPRIGGSGHSSALQTRRDDTSALDLAAEEGHSDVVEAFIAHVVDVNAVDAKGVSVLYVATVNSRLNAIRVLMSMAPCQTGPRSTPSVKHMLPVLSPSLRNTEQTCQVLTVIASSRSRTLPAKSAPP